MPNPFRRPETPDKIIQSEDLTPQVRIVGAEYAKPTVRGVAEVPNTNQLEQLAAGLSEINPSLQQYAGRLGQKHTEEEQAAGLEAARKSGEPLAEAVRLKQLDPGGSRQFVDAYQTEIARQRGQKYAASQYDAWSKRTDIHESDDASVMTKFIAEHKAQFDRDNLTAPDPGPYGNTPTLPMFTPVQLKVSGYAAAQEAADAALTRHNTDLRVQARTAKGVDVFTAGIQQILTQGTTTLDGKPRMEHELDYPTMAYQAEEIKRKAIATGLSTAQTTEILSHGVHQSAIEQLNPDLSRKFGLAVDRMRPKEAPLTGTKAWREYDTNARNQIITQQHSQLVAQNYLEDQAVLGTPEERIARKQAAVASADAKSDYERVDLRSKQRDQGHIDNVFDFPNLDAMSPADVKEQDRRLEVARVDNPAHAAHLGEQIIKMREHRADLGDKEIFPQTEMQLRAMITKYPGTTRTTGQIDQAMRDHRIGVEGWLRSHELNKTMGQADLKYHKYLSDPGYTVLESGVGKASLKDETALFGTGNISQTLSQGDFRQQATEWLDHNPNVSITAFNAEMRTHVQPTAFKYNDMAREEQARQDTEKATRKVITDLALSETSVKAIQRNSQQGGDHRNSHGEFYHQGADEELQVMKAQAETDRLAIFDRANASGILKEGHDAARRFNGKAPIETQAEADTRERAIVRAEFDRQFPQKPAAERAAATEKLIKERVRARYMERAARENASTDFGLGATRSFSNLDDIANPPAQ